ncbi:unnamed protein product [Alopecurus aequalis]
MEVPPNSFVPISNARTGRTFKAESHPTQPNQAQNQIPRSLPPTQPREMSTGGAEKSGSGGGAGPVKTPSDFLKSIRGRPVVVKLNSGVDYRGILACLDGYMNIAMEQTEEYVNGQLKNKYGDAFIRGNNAHRSGPSLTERKPSGAFHIILISRSLADWLWW